jgi:hypothetical protein
MKKIGFIITLVSVLNVSSFSADAGLETKRPSVIKLEQAIKRPPVLKLGQAVKRPPF